MSAVAQELVRNDRERWTHTGRGRPHISSNTQGETTELSYGIHPRASFGAHRRGKVTAHLAALSESTGAANGNSLRRDGSKKVTRREQVWADFPLGNVNAMASTAPPIGIRQVLCRATGR